MKRQLLLSALLVLASGVAQAEEPNQPQTLKDAYAGDFVVGAAIGTEQVMGGEPQALELVARQFNSITPENLLKWQEVHPELDTYNWEPADRFVEFGEQNDMFIVGHTLVWHSQVPQWVFEDAEGNPLSRAALLERMRDHIHTVVGRYKGRINGWDVVNEAINDDGSWRETKWREIIGPDYIQKAFEYAHEADPDAELYYNDYNMFHAGKRDAVVQMVQDLKAKGVPIDGVGMQGHWGLDYPALEQADEALTAYGNLGVNVMITELDVNVLPSASGNQGADVSQNFQAQQRLNPYADGLPDDVSEQLANRYADFFRLFMKHNDALTRVTLWGVHDGHSWRNNWPIRGRTAYPLLFNRQYQPKQAFDAVIAVAEE